MTQRRHEPDVDLTQLLKRLIEECRHPARLIELYYWSAEPELAEVMRQYIALPADAQATLHAFLTVVKDEPGSVSVRIAENGEITLASPAAVELARTMANRHIISPMVH